MAETVRRYDSCGPLLRMHRRASDGAVLAEGYARREGVLEYRNADGTVRRELVTREAVEDTARTLPRASVTLEHPPEFVNANNVDKYGVGDVDGTCVIEETAQGGFVRVSVAVRRADAIDALRAGKKELSVGYDVTLDPTPGVHPVHGRFDARQVACVGNHLAIVDAGRAGAGVALRTDADDRAAVVNWKQPKAREDHMNPKLVQLLALLGVERVDAEDVALEAGVAAAKTMKADAAKYTDEYVESLAKEKKDADKSMQAMKADMEKMQGENEALKSKLADMDKKEQDRKDAADLATFQALAKAVGVKAEGLKLGELKVALAKTRVDSVTAETPPERLDGILEVVRADAQRKDGREAGARAWAGAGIPRVDGDDAGNGNGERADKKSPSAIQMERKAAAYNAAGGEA